MRVDKFISVFTLLIVCSCIPKPDIPDPDSGTADLIKTIAVGGNYLTGYQDGAIFNEGQQHSIPALLAEQFALAGGGDFNQPLLPENLGFGLNSKQWQSDFLTRSVLGYKFDCEGEEGLSPLKNIISLNDQSASLQTLAATGYQNLAVPFATMEDIFDPSFGKSYGSGNSNPFYYRFATDPGNSTIFSDALAQDPTFLIL